MLCVWGCLKMVREKNLLGMGMSATAAAVFGWFAVMSILFPQ
nr:DUF2759 family protein [Caldalkalibacillus salinus]